jgi:mannan endo-1,4-beta-mannosidase
MGGSSKHQDFFTSAAIKSLYKQHISFMAARVNSINGRKYADDPTIMAWNLANEARCQGCGSAPMQSWISEMCQHVKAVAPRHLVGIGYEGFYGPDSGRTQLNPGSGSDWASKEGQDFARNVADPCIDYVRRARRGLCMRACLLPLLLLTSSFCGRRGGV